MSIYARLLKGESGVKEYESQLTVMPEQGWIKINSNFNCNKDRPIGFYLSPQHALQLAIKIVDLSASFIKQNSQEEGIPAIDALQFASKLMRSSSKHVQGLHPSFDPDVPSFELMRLRIDSGRTLVPFKDPS
jgi:hypothetical protein